MTQSLFHVVRYNDLASIKGTPAYNIIMVIDVTQIGQSIDKMT